MFKKLFLCVIIASSAHAASWEPTKKPTLADITSDSVRYALHNPIKVAVASYLLLNLCIHGKKSIVCKGFNWTFKDLPFLIMDDSSLAIDSVEALAKNSYKFLLSK